MRWAARGWIGLGVVVTGIVAVFVARGRLGGQVDSGVDVTSSTTGSVQATGEPSMQPPTPPDPIPVGGSVASSESARVRSALPTKEEIAKLPADGGPEFNRLIFETSPYLLQHSRNPVDWYAWGSAAFERARVEGKPIFLSIGYSTCHWCHVMEHESFEDPEVAKLLNELFVCIKVDREERPDVDEIYMTVTQGMTGSGGWPMTVVLTPDREPFFAATYIPKRGRAGRPGMMELLPDLARAWREDRERVVASARSATEWLQARSTHEVGAELTADVLQRAEQELAARYDARWGGFGTAPKFPTPHNLRLLLRRWNRTGDQRVLDMVVGTLRSMRNGGVWDHVGFGFHRYSTDSRWLLPHFEKMLYDQALISLACVEAWQATGDDELRRTAVEVFTYVLRDMTAPEGGFYSAEDADSAGEEGLFYTWTPAELVEVLGADDGAVAAEVWGVRDGGNFRDQASGGATGRSVLHLQSPLDQVAAKRGAPPAEFIARVDSIRARLFEARESRIHPHKDDKILTDWNGLMIAALAYAGRAFQAPEYIDAARRSAEFAFSRSRTKDGRLLKSWRDGPAGGAGVHDDYAFLTWGLIELYESSGDSQWLKRALELVETERELFADPEVGGYFLAAKDAEHLIARPKTAYDGAIPSGNSVSALNHLRLARLTGRTELEEEADRTLRAFANPIRQSPSSFSQCLLAVDFALGPSFELVVAGRLGSEDMQSALARIHRVFAPNKVVVIRPEGEQGRAISELAPYVAAQTSRDGKLTLYLCRDFACELPTRDVSHIVEELTPRR
jgi:hypothetical protein